MGFVYTWIRYQDGRDAEYGAHLMEQMAGALAQYARARRTRLIGQPQLDFPALTSLPPCPARARCAMFSAERRPWRWGCLTLVRIWQDTAPEDGGQLQCAERH
ncbi:hypothetical protein [Streptomyces ardesiacus]|uniref:hypothetical protein n=1 Tax=Streptomyces ardesiacus TaxID=285564 RepID=UPI00369A306F